MGKETTDKIQHSFMIKKKNLANLYRKDVLQHNKDYI